MIINNNVQRIFNVNGVTGCEKTSAVSKVKSVEKTMDTVALSEKAQDYTLVKNRLNEIPDIREDKIASLKSRMDSGNYEVNTKDLVNKLFSDI